MNHNAILSILLLLLCICQCCFGAVGCMDNSWHLKKSYDYKNFHYVTDTVDPDDPNANYCQCPCDQYIAQYGKQVPRGRCPVCKHYRVPLPVIIVNNALEKYKQYEGAKNHEFKKVKRSKKYNRKTNPKKGIKSALALWRTLTAHPKAVTMR